MTASWNVGNSKETLTPIILLTIHSLTKLTRGVQHWKLLHAGYLTTVRFNEPLFNLKQSQDKYIHAQAFLIIQFQSIWIYRLVGPSKSFNKSRITSKSKQNESSIYPSGFVRTEVLLDNAFTLSFLRTLPTHSIISQF